MAIDAYSELELKSRLGEPVSRGYLPGDSSKGWADFPGHKLRKIALGANEFMRWTCLPEHDDGCTAIFPEYGPNAGRGWILWHVCEKHKPEFEENDLNDIFGIETREPLPPTDLLLIVDATSYSEQRGSDWDMVERYLNDDWVISLVHSDRRFPNFLFLVLRKKYDPLEIT